MRTFSDLTNVGNLSDNLPPHIRPHRVSILEKMVTYGGNLPLERLSLEESSSLEQMRACGAVVIENDAIVFAYPVSGQPTAHRVTLADGRSFYAMCGIDALGSAFTFHQDTAIVSRCAVTGETVRAEVKNGDLVAFNPATAHVIHVELKEGGDWFNGC